MKNKLVATAIALLIGSSAQAELRWATTAFWRSPYNNKLALRIKGIDSNLDSDCAEYRDIVESSPGRSNLDPQEIDFLRTLTNEISHLQFTAKFKIQSQEAAKAIRNAISESNSAANQHEFGDSLPYYNLLTTEILPSMVPSGEISVQTGLGSLTQISKNAGLKPLTITVQPSDLETVIKVTGKDVACDLHQGRATLTYKSTAAVKISLADQLRSDQIYRELAQVTNWSFAKKATPVARAALIGYKLEPLLRPIVNNAEQGETIVSALLETFFSPTLERNQNWTYFAGDYHLSVSGTSLNNPIELEMRN